MIHVARSCTVVAPLEAVWRTLADFAAISTWADDVDHSCLLSAADDDGTGLTRRVQVGRTTLIERVVTWDPPHELSYDISGLPPVVRSVRNQWDLVDVGTSSTTVTLTSTVDAGPRPPQQVIARLVGRRLAKASDSMLAGLAAHVEDRARV